jgi:hypothetical protein
MDFKSIQEAILLKIRFRNQEPIPKFSISFFLSTFGRFAIVGLKVSKRCLGLLPGNFGKVKLAGHLCHSFFLFKGGWLIIKKKNKTTT